MPFGSRTGDARAAAADQRAHDRHTTTQQGGGYHPGTLVSGSLAGTAALLVGMVWLTGQLAGLLFAGRWLDVTASQALLTAARLTQHWRTPATAWPAPAAQHLPGPVAMAFCALVVLLIVASLVVTAERFRPGSRTRHWKVRPRLPHPATWHHLAYGLLAPVLLWYLAYGLGANITLLVTGAAGILAYSVLRHRTLADHRAREQGRIYAVLLDEFRLGADLRAETWTHMDTWRTPDHPGPWPTKPWPPPPDQTPGQTVGTDILSATPPDLAPILADPSPTPRTLIGARVRWLWDRWLASLPIVATRATVRAPAGEFEQVDLVGFRKALELHTGRPWILEPRPADFEVTLREGQWLPDFAPYPTTYDHTRYWEFVPKGLYLDDRGRLLTGYHDLRVDSKRPHMITAGTTGGGKTIAGRGSIYHYCMSNRCTVLLADPKRFELKPFEGKQGIAPRGFWTTRPGRSDRAVTLDEIVEMCELAEAIMDDRQERIDVSDDPKIVEKIIATEGLLILFIEEAADVMDTEKATRGTPLTDDAKRRNGLRARIVWSTKRVARFGRASGVRLDTNTQRPSDETFSSELKVNVEARMITGALNARSTAMVLEADILPHPPTDTPPGRSLWKVNALKVVSLQAFYISEDLIASIPPRTRVLAVNPHQPRQLLRPPEPPRQPQSSSQPAPHRKPPLADQSPAPAVPSAPPVVGGVDFTQDVSGETVLPRIVRPLPADDDGEASQ